MAGSHHLYVSNLERSLFSAVTLCRSGALGGMPMQKIESLFQSITFSFMLTAGGGNINTAQDPDGVRYFRWTTNPYPIEMFSNGNNMRELYAQIEEEMVNHVASYDDHYEDNSDIPNYDERWNQTPRDGPEELKFKMRTFVQRMDQCDVKFIPRVTLDDTFHQKLSPILFRSEKVNPATLISNLNEPILPEGDAEEKMYTEPAEEESEDEAGCIIDKKDMLEKSLARLQCIWTPPNKADNDCFLRCVIANKRAEGREHEIPEEEITLKIKTLRLLLHAVPEGAKVNAECIQTIADYTGDIYRIWKIKDIVKLTESDKLMEEGGRKAFMTKEFRNTSTYEGVRDDDKRLYRVQLDFLFHKGHCYAITNPLHLVDKVKCSQCTQWIKRSTFSRHEATCHYCTVCRRTYSSSRKNKEHECRGARALPHESRQRKQDLRESGTHSKWIPLEPVEKQKRMTPANQIYFADIEAFPDVQDHDSFTSYAIEVISNKEDAESVVFWGRDAMAGFLKHCEQLSGTIYFFNGARFDNYLILRGMLDHGYHVDSQAFLKNGGSILTFKMHGKLKVRDLCRYINSSLASACKGWGVPKDMQKKDFEHEKIWDYESAERHKVEVLYYLKYDVLSLRELYRIYSRAQFECFSMDVNRALSLSQYGFKCWATTCPELPNIYVPHQGKEEDDDRAAYYGGRVGCFRKEYVSQDFKEDQLIYEFEKIEDYLVIADVNSLYPSVQARFKYAFGKWRYWPQMEILMMPLSKINKIENEGWMLRCCFHISVECPKDILVPFLMERNAQGKIQHNLNDKKAWYWGCELIEAIILGYRVTWVHEIKEFEKYGDLFSTFVKTCWDGRIANPKPSVKNLAYKQIMNCVTGKFGQKSHPTNTTIYNAEAKTEEAKKDFQELIAKVVDFEPILSKSGDNHALILETLSDSPHPAYPIYLSAQILAYARVYMSHIYRACNAYLDPSNAVYYTDTDSLILPSHCVPLLAEFGYIGTKLGQLSCDLHDPFNGQFARILRGVWGAPKGPYSLVYVTPHNGIAKEKIRTKGIPHPDGPFPYREEIELHLTPENYQLVRRLLNWIDDPVHHQVPAEFIKQRFYMFKTHLTGETYFARHINFKHIQMMMSQSGEMTCYFGSMQKSLLSNMNSVLSVSPTINRRIVCHQQWWPKSGRQSTNEEDVTAMTVPDGYEPNRVKHDLTPFMHVEQII